MRFRPSFKAVARHSRVKLGRSKLWAASWQLLTLLVAMAIGPNSHADELGKVLRSAFTGAQFRDYIWLDYPLDNFGVASAYKGSSSQPMDAGFLCATFDCFSTQIPSDIDKWRRVVTPAEPNGFAGVGCGGSAEQTLQGLDQVGAQAFLSSILKALSFSASASAETAKSVKVTFESACVRKLMQGRYENWLATSHETLGLANAYKEGNLVLVVADVVVSGLHIVVEPSRVLKAELEAKLQGSVGKALTGPAGAQAQLSTAERGKFELISPRPMIVGYIAVQRGGRPIGRAMGAAAGSLDWIDWDPVSHPLVLPVLAKP